MKAFRIVVTLLLIALMVTIFFFSSQTATQSSETSGNLIKTVIRVFYPDFDEMNTEEQESLIESFQFYVRKGAHLFIYSVMGGLAFLTFITYKNIPIFLRVFISFLVCVLYSVSDEIHQRYVAGRSGEVRDVIIDSSGALLAILVMTLFTRCRVFYKYVYNGDLMRKKDLKELYNQAYDKISELNLELENVRFENEKLNNRVKEFEIKESLAVKEQATQIREDVTVVNENVNNKPQLFTPEKELGAQAIGKVIVNATKYCGRLSNVAESKDVKELINLVLGRTEVAKAEILNIVTSKLDMEEMYLKVNVEIAAAEDYFKSVLGQI